MENYGFYAVVKLLAALSLWLKSVSSQHVFTMHFIFLSLASWYNDCSRVYMSVISHVKLENFFLIDLSFSFFSCCTISSKLGEKSEWSSTKDFNARRVCTVERIWDVWRFVFFFFGNFEFDSVAGLSSDWDQREREKKGETLAMRQAVCVMRLTNLSDEFNACGPLLWLEQDRKS